MPERRLAARLEDLARAAGLPATLADLGAERADIAALAADAATQWTGTFNPRPFDASAAQQLYEAAFSGPPLHLGPITAWSTKTTKDHKEHQAPGIFLVVLVVFVGFVFTS